MKHFCLILLKLLLLAYVCVSQDDPRDQCICTSAHPQIAICRRRNSFDQSGVHSRLIRNDIMENKDTSMTLGIINCIALRGKIRSKRLIPDRRSVNLRNDPDLKHHDFKYRVKVLEIFTMDTILYICEISQSLPSKDLDVDFMCYSVSYSTQRNLLNDNLPIRVNRMITVFTYAAEGMCPANLTVGETYLIFGGNIHEIKSKLYTSSCSSNQVWRTLTLHQRLSLRKEIYINNCQCVNLRSNRIHCRLPASRDHTCHFRYATCIESTRRGNTPCRWKSGPRLRRCFRQLSNSNVS